MIEAVAAPAYIERIAVRKERTTAVGADIIHEHTRILRAKIRKVARLAKMDLDRHIFILQVELAKARRIDQTLQLLRQVLL